MIVLAVVVVIVVLVVVVVVWLRRALLQDPRTRQLNRNLDHAHFRSTQVALEGL